MQYLNDGSGHAPRLRYYLNLMTLDGLATDSIGPKGDFESQLAAIKSAGFDGVEFISRGESKLCHATGLGMSRAIRVNTVEEADTLPSELVDLGHEFATAHVGWGIEDDTQALGLLESVVNASDKHNLPIFVETHRSTVLQDMWRSKQFVSRLPGLRLNADLSHWYTGQEMIYGGFEISLIVFGRCWIVLDLSMAELQARAVSK